MNEKNNQMEKNENQPKIEENSQKISSPSTTQKESKVNLSPEGNLMNQKYFPSKENYFGVKTSPNFSKDKSVSPGSQSPILNYFSNISPERQDFYYSNNNNSNKLSPNFNYSPSTIFNNNNKDKNIFDSFSLQNSGNAEEESKTLQEKMEQYVSKTDANNFIRKGSIPSNSSNPPENKNEEDENDEDEEAFTLTINNYEDDNLDFNKYKSIADEFNNQSNKISIFKNMNNPINNENNSKINNESNVKNENNLKKETNVNNNKNKITEQQNQSLNQQEKKISTDKSDKDNNDIKNLINTSNEELKGNENLVKNIINKKEFKPYIPNKYRNQINDINNQPNFFDDTNFNININNLNEMNLGLDNFNDNKNIFNQNFNNDFNNFNINNNNQNYLPNNYNLNFLNNQDLNSQIQQNFYPESNLYNSFYYNGDKYQISNFKEYKKKNYSKTGEIPSISAADIVTTITANNKKIKRIDPNTYLNESIEYLAYNIFPLAKDQAGCRFLQEKLDKEPKRASEAFYNAIIPFVLPLVKDSFGNYLIQKLCYFLTPEKIKKFLEIISPTILDIGSNCHGTRVIQHIISFLSTKELVNYFLNSIKPFVIPLLKELNGTHIINKFINEHPECAEEINKIIVENCSLLATHRHGCCILQKLMEGPNKKLRNELIENLVENCFVLIIDQFGNYVIQNILILNDSKASAAIALKICDNIQYYSKHRYSSNVIEKCFDFCGKKERKKLIEKLCSPDIIADLILDEHGNYVIQKALFFADNKEKEIIFNNIVKLIPKIITVSFGEKLLTRLISAYPQLNNIINKTGDMALKEKFNNIVRNNKKNKKKTKKNKKNNKNYDNNENLNDNNVLIGKNNGFINSNILNNNINVNNNITINNFSNINNNPMNLNRISNNDNNPINFLSFNNDLINNNFNPNIIPENNIENFNEQSKKKKKKKDKTKNNKEENQNIKKNFNNNISNNINNNDIFNPNLMMMNNNNNNFNYINQINFENSNFSNNFIK